jgi:hypothetical protein
MSHPVKKGSQGRCLLLQDLLACVALDDHRLIEEQYAALGIVTPDAPALGKGRRTAEKRSQHGHGFAYPKLLVNRFVGPVLAWDEQDQQRRGNLAGPQDSGKLGHAEDLRFFLAQYLTFCPKSQGGLRRYVCQSSPRGEKCYTAWQPPFSLSAFVIR